MEIKLVDRSDIRLDHELIWGLIGLVLALAAMLFPFEHFHFACPFKSVVGLPCLTCGTTRSMLALRRFDLGGAFVDNPLMAALAVFAGAYCLYAWSAVVLRTRRIRVRTTKQWEPTLIRVLVVVVIAGNWIYLIAMGR